MLLRVDCTSIGCHNDVEQHQSLRHARWVASNRSSHRRFAPFLACGCDHHFVRLKFIFCLWKWKTPPQEKGLGSRGASFKTENVILIYRPAVRRTRHLVGAT